MLPPIDDQEIVQGLIQNNSEIINYLYSEVGPKVMHVIMKAGGSREEANDIFQEGIISTYENIRSGRYELRPDVKFTTYLIRVCKYKWYDTAKSAHKRKMSGLENDFMDEEESVLEGLIRSEKYKALHSMIDQLNERCKEILNRYYWKRESMKEIGEALNMNPKSVKNGKYRCMKELQTLTHHLTR